MADAVQGVPGALYKTTLSGLEYVDIWDGATKTMATSQAIGNLAGNGSNVANTNITTAVGGTLTAAGIVGGLITRTGPTANFSDATAAASAIVALVPNAYVGQSFEVSIKNATAFQETLTAGNGVTLPAAPATQIGPNSVAEYLVTITAIGASPTVTFTNVNTTRVAQMPPAQFTTAALTAGTLGAGVITGAAFTVLQNTGATPGAQTVRTAAQMLADFPQARVGDSFQLRIVNTGAGTLTLTADAGPTVTITGTATVAQNVFRDYVVTFNTATTATIQSIGSGTSP